MADQPGLWGQLQDAGWLTTSARSTEQGGADHALVSPHPQFHFKKGGHSSEYIGQQLDTHIHLRACQGTAAILWTARGLMATRGYCTF